MFLLPLSAGKKKPRKPDSAAIIEHHLVYTVQYQTKHLSSGNEPNENDDIFHWAWLARSVPTTTAWPHSLQSILSYLLSLAMFLTLLLSRFADCAECHPDGADPPVQHHAVGHVRHHHLRHHRAGALLRHLPQGLLQWNHRYILSQTEPNLDMVFHQIVGKLRENYKENN